MMQIKFYQVWFDEVNNLFSPPLSSLYKLFLMYVLLPVDMLVVVDNNQIGDVCLTFWIIWLPIIDSLQNLCERWVVSQVDIFDSLQNYLMYRDGSWNTCWLCCIWPFSNPCCLCCGSESRRIEKDSWYRSLAGGAVLVFLGIHLALYNFRGNFRIPLSCELQQWTILEYIMDLLYMFDSLIKN